MVTRNDIHRLADRIPEAELHAALRFLEYLVEAADPVGRAFDEAPEDDEPETEEEAAAVAEAREDIVSGRMVGGDVVWDEVGGSGVQFALKH